MQVTNGAGLISVRSSLGYTLDATPPLQGNVYNGQTAELSNIRYTTNLGHLSFHWSGFSDPHSGIVEYFLRIGTEPEGGDVLEEFTVGLMTCKFIL